MAVHASYDAAVTEAATKALSTGLAYGLSVRREYGRNVYTVRVLPSPALRFGVDLRCEVIDPSNAALALAAHTPTP